MCPGENSRIEDKTLLCNWKCLENKVKKVQFIEKNIKRQDNQISL